MSYCLTSLQVGSSEGPCVTMTHDSGDGRVCSVLVTHRALSVPLRFVSTTLADTRCVNPVHDAIVEPIS